MPHLITILCAIIAVMGLIWFSFQQEEVPENLLNHKTQHTSPISSISMLRLF